MKKTGVISIATGLFMLYGTGMAVAEPMDLSTFAVIENQPGSVVESGGAIDFTESTWDSVLYFYDDFNNVDPFATTLSFDYDFTLGQFDMGDYLQLNINYVEQWYVDTSGSGHVEFDLTPYQGTTIAVDWALVWGGDWDATTTARVYNIDVATQAAPVPEPATMLLFSTGLAGLIGAARKKRSKGSV